MKTELYIGDCLELMKDIPDGSVDLILCDLPYGAASLKWDVVIPFEPLWEQYRRVMKPNATVALFGTEPFSSLIRMSNPKMYKYDWVWDKGNAGNFQLANEQPLKVHETISIFYNNKTTKVFSDIIVANMKRLGLPYEKVSALFPSRNGNKTGWLSNKISGKQLPTKEQWAKLCEMFGIPDEYEELRGRVVKHTYNMELRDVNVTCSDKGKGGNLNRLASEKKRESRTQTKSGYPRSIVRFGRETGIHPTQKPVPLLEYLIRTYTNRGGVVLDNCMGSGSTGVACVRTGRDFIGIEIDGKMVELAERRIKDELACLSQLKMDF